MLKLLCSITLLHLLRVLLNVEGQTNMSNLTLNKDLETSDVVNPSLTSNISTISDNLSDSKTTSDVVNPSLTSNNVTTRDNVSDLETTADVVNPSLTSNNVLTRGNVSGSETTSNVLNTSLDSNSSTSGNFSDAQFAIQPRALRQKVHLPRRERRRQDHYGDSGSDEVYPLSKQDSNSDEVYPLPEDFGSEEDYSENCRECQSESYEKSCELPPPPAPPPPPPPLPPPPKPSITYFIVNIKMDWHRARDDCWSRGLKLATILSREEQKNIEAIIEKQGLKWNDHFWIGAMDSYNGEFRWLEPPTPFYYTNWDINEPNRGVLTPGYLNDEHCLELKNYHKWNDLNCDAKEFFICQTK